VDPALQSGQLQRKQILLWVSWDLNTVLTVRVAAVSHTKIQPSHHRLNMEFDLLSLFGPHVHSCTHWLRPRNPPPSAFELKYEGAIGQPR
jgi:hypothetical protein